MYAIVELPDNTTAAAAALAINADGRSHVQTVVLHTPEQIDAAATRTVSYATPGTTRADASAGQR